MPTELFLNELSVPVGALSEHAARDQFKSFVACVRALSKMDRSAVLNADVSVDQLQIGTDYSVASLRNHGNCVEESQFLKALQSRSPFSRVVDQKGHQHEGEFEYKIAADGTWQGQIASGLGLAHQYSGLGVSFASDAFWERERIALLLSTLKEDAEDIDTVAVEAHNCYSALQSDDFRALLTSNEVEPRDGAEIWERRIELFPFLDFIPRVRSQLSGLLKGDRSFQAALSRLRDLNRDVGAWREGTLDHPKWSFYVRPESESRINSGLVTFHVEDGSSATFSDHADFGPAEGRIHFLLESQPVRRALVGHVGRKLGIG